MTLDSRLTRYNAPFKQRPPIPPVFILMSRPEAQRTGLFLHQRDKSIPTKIARLYAKIPVYEHIRAPTPAPTKRKFPIIPVLLLLASLILLFLVPRFLVPKGPTIPSHQPHCNRHRSSDLLRGLPDRTAGSDFLLEKQFLSEMR